MAHFVLVHGSWHGAWCWEKIIPILQAAGDTVMAPELPGHGQDKTPLIDITLNSYIKCVTQVIENSLEPVILVGHSMAGIVITEVAQRLPEKIKKLIYITAFIPENGESMEMVSEKQTSTRFSKLMKRVPEENAFYFPVHAMKSFAYHLCDDSLFESLKPRFCVEPLSPILTPVKINEKIFGQIPKVYIECEADRAILHITQQCIHQAIACEVFTLNCDHSPFYSDPQGLSAILLDQKNNNRI